MTLARGIHPYCKHSHMWTLSHTLQIKKASKMSSAWTVWGAPGSKGGRGPRRQPGEEGGDTTPQGWISVWTWLPHCVLRFVSVWPGLTFYDLVYHPLLVILCYNMQMPADVVPRTGLAWVDAGVDMASSLPTEVCTDDTGCYSHEPSSPSIQVCFLLGRRSQFTMKWPVFTMVNIRSMSGILASIYINVPVWHSPMVCRTRTLLSLVMNSFPLRTPSPFPSPSSGPEQFFLQVIKALQKRYIRTLLLDSWGWQSNQNAHMYDFDVTNLIILNWMWYVGN